MSYSISEELRRLHAQSDYGYTFGAVGASALGAVTAAALLDGPMYNAAMGFSGGLLLSAGIFVGGGAIGRQIRRLKDGR